MQLHKLSQRKCDEQGCGHYGASRVHRIHNGVDLCINPNNPIQCGFGGVAVKIGYPYSGQSKSHIRYAAIKFDLFHQGVMAALYGADEWYCRVFYIKPEISVGYLVTPQTIIGESQDLGVFYPNITQHVHFELYKLTSLNAGIHAKKNFEYVDPNKFLKFLRSDV